LLGLTIPFINAPYEKPGREEPRKHFLACRVVESPETRGFAHRDPEAWSLLEFFPDPPGKLE